MASIDISELFFNDYQPKVKNSFIMYLDGIPAYTIKMANRPSIQFDTIVMDHINIKRKLQGKGEWQDITIGLYDPITPSAANAVMEWVRQSHNSLTGQKGYASTYKKDITLDMLGPVGDIVEEWVIHGAFINQANFQDLDWSSGADVAMVELTIAYDYAILEF